MQCDTTNERKTEAGYQSQILEPTNITSAFHKQATFRRKTASRVLKPLTVISFGVSNIVTMSYNAHT